MKNIELLANRIKLTKTVKEDLTSIHQLLSLPETDAFNTLGIPKDEKATGELVQTWVTENERNEMQNYTFSIKSINQGDFIGLIGLKLGNSIYRRAEVWFKIHVNFWNQGYAMETLQRLLDFAFNDLQLHRMEAGCAVGNLGSVRVLEKVGMIREGRGRQVLPLKTGWSDNFEYGLLETDYRKN